MSDFLAALGARAIGSARASASAAPGEPGGPAGPTRVRPRLPSRFEPGFSAVAGMPESAPVQPARPAPSPSAEDAHGHRGRLTPVLQGIPSDLPLRPRGGPRSAVPAGEAARHAEDPGAAAPTGERMRNTARPVQGPEPPSALAPDTRPGGGPGDRGAAGFSAGPAGVDLGEHTTVPPSSLRHRRPGGPDSQEAEHPDTAATDPASTPSGPEGRVLRPSADLASFRPVTTRWLGPNPAARTVVAGPWPDAMRAPSGEDQEPTRVVQVSIGRIEVRGPARAPRPPAPVRPRAEAPRKLTLEEYLDQRSGGRR